MRRLHIVQARRNLRRFNHASPVAVAMADRHAYLKFKRCHARRTSRIIKRGEIGS
jgi:hypothetical protein